MNEVDKKVLANNLKIVNKRLKTPEKFKLEGEYQDKACFSQGYKKYGYLENWDIALNTLNNLPVNENIFNELILEHNKVKPYLDIEWMKSDFPDYDPDHIKFYIKEALKEIFNKSYNVSTLNTNDIHFASCHRIKKDGFKYSFHVVISTHQPMLVFTNANHASLLAKQLRKSLKKDGKYSPTIIDIGVYKKTQNFRLINHSKEGEYVKIIKLQESVDDFEFLITNIESNFTLLESEEQADLLCNLIKNISVGTIYKKGSTEFKEIMTKVNAVHPTAEFNGYDSNGFLQFNYSNRKEPCFTNECKDTFHSVIGFFAYIYKDLLCIGCHSGNCVDSTNHKITKVLGSIKPKKEAIFLKVDEDNTFDLDHAFVRNCIYDEGKGMAKLFEKMFLEPKRIKWINDTSRGTTFFWDGKIWVEDDFSFIESLLVSTIVRVLRDFNHVFRDNPEIVNDSTEDLIKRSNALISKLNNGLLINTIVRFIKPSIRDLDFGKVKDIHPGLLSVKNGVVCLTKGTIRSSVPDDNITKFINTEYNPNADSSDFENFIRQITSNEQGECSKLYNFFRWCIGYSMQGIPKKKIFIILYGPHGNNGKSLALNIIKEVLEHYVVTMDSSVVLDNGTKKTGGSHSSEMCQLENCRLGLLSDTKEDAAIADGQIKQLTGITDKMSVREIFGKQKEFTPTFVPIISTNHPIQVNLSDQAMYERLILFPFILSFVENPKESYQRPRDSSLAEKFQENKEGILKWLIECSVYYNKNQDKPVPDIINKAKEKYNRQVNTYIDFLDSYNQTGASTDKIPRTELISSYKLYMTEIGMGNKCKVKTAEREFDKILTSDTIKGKKYYTGIAYKIIEGGNEDDELL